MDFSHLAQKLGLEEDEFLELVTLFVDTGRTTLSSLHACLSRDDYDGAAKEAHSFKGAAGNLGFKEMHENAKALESAVKSRIPGDITLRMDQLTYALEELSLQVS